MLGIIQTREKSRKSLETWVTVEASAETELLIADSAGATGVGAAFGANSLQIIFIELIETVSQDMRISSLD